MPTKWEIDFDYVRRRIAAGKNLPQIASEMGVPYVTLWRRVKKERIDYTRPGSISRKQRVQIAEMRERGLSYGQIALQFGVSISVVYYHCIEQGAVHPRGYGTPRHGPTRGNPFSTDEDKLLQELSKKGMSPHFIAKEIGRPANSVRARLCVLAIRDEQEAA